jgi:hypothetical protein
MVMIDKRQAEAAEQKERIDSYLRRSGLAGQSPRIVPLTGDASDRRYFRVIPGSGPTYVLAVYAEPFVVSTLPFVNVGELFDRMPAPVPAVLGHADDLGVLALQDLGDVTLQAHLGAAAAEEHARLYREAVRLIELFQRRGAELADPRYMPYGVAFDAGRLMWELDFFIRHFVEGYRGAVLPAPEGAALRAELGRIAEELAAEPRVLCHRDYHSRNLMLHGDRLAVIDFQDARLGPDTYDLASLLRDSYVDVTEAQLDELLTVFLSAAGRTGERPRFRIRFDLMALQRNLKALGTFGYQTAVRQNPVYIQYMPRTLRYVRENLHKYERFGRLAELLAARLPELV